MFDVFSSNHVKAKQFVLIFISFQLLWTLRSYLLSLWYVLCNKKGGIPHLTKPAKKRQLIAYKVLWDQYDLNLQMCQKLKKNRTNLVNIVTLLERSREKKKYGKARRVKMDGTKDGP